MYTVRRIVEFKLWCEMYWLELPTAQNSISAERIVFASCIRTADLKYIGISIYFQRIDL